MKWTFFSSAAVSGWQSLAVFALLCFIPQAAADGLTELRAALAQLQGTSAISARLQTTVEDIDGQGEEQKIRPGRATVWLNDDDSGLQVTYSHAMLTQIDSEAAQKISDETAETPTLNAVNSFNATELRSMLSAASALQRRLEQADFIAEKAILYNGSPARELVFSLPLEAIIDEQQIRKYVRTFSGQFSVVIDDRGIPQESRLSFTGQGRAFLVLRVEASVSDLEQYQVVGQRLVRVSSRSESSYSTTFGEGSYVRVDRLELPDSVASTEQAGTDSSTPVPAG